MTSGITVAATVSGPVDIAVGTGTTTVGGVAATTVGGVAATTVDGGGAGGGNISMPRLVEVAATDSVVLGL